MRKATKCAPLRMTCLFRLNQHVYSQSISTSCREMTSKLALKILLAIVMAQIVFSSPVNERPFSTLELQQRKQTNQHSEIIISSQEKLNHPQDPNDGSEESEPAVKFKEPVKIFIRPASLLTTPKPNGRQQLSERELGCSCQHIDNCSIEQMDFSFAVSCEYGTVRCCRPLETVLTKETFLIAPTTPTPTTSKRVVVKKTPACKCKPYNECERFSNHSIKDDGSINQRDGLSCPVGLIRCCDLERGNTVNFSEPSTSEPETHVLGNSEFRPVQLPFMKITSTNQRISEQEAKPTVEEFEPNEKDVSFDIPSTTTTEEPSEALINQKIVPMHQPLPTQHFHQHPRPLAIPPQQLAQPFGPVSPSPFRPQMTNAGIPVRQLQGPPPFELQQLAPQNNGPNQGFLRPTNPPFRQQQQQQPSSQFKFPLNFITQNQQQMPIQHQLNGFPTNSGIPPNQQFIPSTVDSFPQRLRRPIPTTNPPFVQPGFPPQQQQPSGGGFLSTLMNIFNN